MEIEIKGMPKCVEVHEKFTTIKIYHVKKPSQKLFRVIDGSNPIVIKVTKLK